MPVDTALEEVRESGTNAGLPAINVSPAQGKFLHLLTRIHGARLILEIGTLGGYSTIWLARALQPGGKVVTLELDPKHAAVGRKNFEAGRVCRHHRTARGQGTRLAGKTGGG